METTERRYLKFVGIGNWNRAIFKDNNENYFGNYDILFSYNATEEEVLKKITENDIYYFGQSFGCEPLGTKIDPNKIKLKQADDHDNIKE